MIVESFTKQVAGSTGNFYEVGVITDSSIRVTCECMGAKNGSLCKHVRAVLLELTSSICDEPIKQSLINLGVNEYIERVAQAEVRCEEAKKELNASKKQLSKMLGLRK